jgi:hypothetical protein
MELYVKKRTLHGVELWWICEKRGKQYIPYADVHAPTGYGFKSKVKCERIAKEIEERLKQ